MLSIKFSAGRQFRSSKIRFFAKRQTGTSTWDSLYVSGTYHNPQFKPILKAIKKTTSLRMEFGYEPPYDPDGRMGRSDHLVFHLMNIPYLYFGVPVHSNYHLPTDDYDNISHSFYYKVVSTVLKTIISMDENFPGKF